MGRLFQYNRFGGTQRPSKKDNTPRSHVASRHPQEMPPTRGNCPAYSELYPAATATATARAARTTTKSVELAIRKYQKWSSRFLPTSAATIMSSPASDASRCPRVAAAAASAAPPCSCSTTMASRSTAKGDRETLLATEQRRPRVYDCMKDFLRKRLFHQDGGDSKSRDLRASALQEATSDYEEADDLLECSYNADDEDATDSSSNTCSTPTSRCSSVNEDRCDGPQQRRGTPHPSRPEGGPPKAALSLSCWHYDASSSSSSQSSSEECDREGRQRIGEDEDADADDGFADAAPYHFKYIYRRSSERQPPLPEPAELLASAWYQPRITFKAASEHLQRAAPGAFLVRRRAHTYELCLRAESKVKRLTVVGGPYRLRLKGARKEFSSLLALVTHHSVMAEQLPVTLALPRAAPMRCADDFDTFESLQILGILQSLQAKSFDLS